MQSTQKANVWKASLSSKRIKDLEEPTLLGLLESRAVGRYEILGRHTVHSAQKKWDHNYYFLKILGGHVPLCHPCSYGPELWYFWKESFFLIQSVGRLQTFKELVTRLSFFSFPSFWEGHWSFWEILVFITNDTTVLLCMLLAKKLPICMGWSKSSVS